MSTNAFCEAGKHKEVQMRLRNFLVFNLLASNNLCDLVQTDKTAHLHSCMNLVASDPLLIEPNCPVPKAPPSERTMSSTPLQNTRHDAPSVPLVKLGFYYFLLYFFTVVYNVANKRVLNALPLPATIGVVQLFLGIPLFLPLWFAKPPRYAFALPLWPLLQVSIAHALGNLATIYSLGAGAVSFTHVVKSAEPVFSAVLAGIVMKSYFAPQVYMALIPIVLGVALASATEIGFSWFAFGTAMISNLFYQLRIVLSKQLIVGSPDSSSKLSGANLFRIITVLAAVFMLPIALLLEGSTILPAWELATVDSKVTSSLVWDFLVSGFSYYLYNEISFWILDLVHPVTHAVGNTIKRVVLIVAALLIFRVPITMQGATGSFIAILGSFLYAMASQKYGGGKG